MGLRLVNEHGTLEINARIPKISTSLQQSINVTTAALFICKNARLEDEVGQPCHYDGKPIFFENQDIHLTFAPKVNEDHDFVLNIRGTEQFRSKKINGRSLLADSIRYSNAAGYTDISIRDITLQRDIISLRAEIYPQKIDYKDDFAVMLHEVTEIINSLAFDYFKKTYLPTEQLEDANQTLSQWLIILKHLFDSLVRNIDLILKRVHSKINTSTAVKNISAVRHLDKTATKWILKNRQYVNSDHCGYGLNKDLNITHLPESRKELSYNTFENQFVVWAIRQITIKISEIIVHINKIYPRNGGMLPAEAKNEIHTLNIYRARLLGRLNDRYLQDISDFNGQFHFSTVLTMAPGYKDFYKSFLLLQKGLSLSANHLFNLDLKDVSLLYEYWCFLKILQTLKDDKDKYELLENDFIKLEHDRFVVKLQKGIKSKVSFIKKNTQDEIDVYFNKAFTRAGNEYITYKQVPDNFIEFRKNGYVNPFWFIFDAKYRFDSGNESDYPETYVHNGPPMDAIGQMHRYRDAILAVQSQKQTYLAAIKSLGGIILFPFPNNEDGFINHPFYKSINKVNIGAIPLRPGQENRLFKEFLDNLFLKTPESLHESVIDYDKSNYESLIKDINSVLLIGLVPEKDNDKRIKFHIGKRLFYTKFNKKYDIDNSSRRLFKTQNIALYSQKDGAIIGYAGIENISYVTSEELIDRGVNWVLSEKEYLLFSLTDIAKCDLIFTGMNLQGKYYSNIYSFNQYLKGESDEYILRFDSFERIRLWKEIKNLDRNCKVTKSNIEFKFRGNTYNCVQNTEDQRQFAINGKVYLLYDDLCKFLIGTS